MPLKRKSKFNTGRVKLPPKEYLPAAQDHVRTSWQPKRSIQQKNRQGGEPLVRELLDKCPGDEE
jgi:hypothetical protein